MTTAFENFLNDYRPADPIFTSFDEVYTIKEKVIGELIFEKKEVTPENVRQVRNQVVKFYDKFFESCTDTRTEKFYDKMEALQSVTAAIDYLITTIGGDI